ncbi:MAG: dihydrolipoyllysine-residue acetyltransferase [Woeseiaceae bacterium]
MDLFEITFAAWQVRIVAQSIDIKVPDLGDFSDVEIIEVLAKAGDRVAPEDGLITLETDKAAMDVPATDAGEVLEITVAVGDKVSSGDVIGRLQPDAQGEESSQANEQQTDEEKENGESEEASPSEADDESAEAEKEASDDTETAAPKSVGKQTLDVPDLGDFSDVEVIEVHVREGDEVGVDDPLITLETDKAAMDVPATAAGRIESVLVKVGDKVSKGSKIATVEATEAPAETGPKAEKAPGKKPAAEARQPDAAVQKPAKPEASAQTGKALPAIDEAGFANAHASPSVRKLARELGVDLVRVKGSGPKDRVLHDDVKAFVKAILSGQAAAPGGALPKVPEVDFARFGEVETRPLTRIQKIAGPRLQASWINLPHVTQHDLADITELEAKRQELKGSAKDRGINLTPLAFVMKACVAALREFPKANASLAADGNDIVYKHYCHLGFAADTENGLMVPVIRDADKKDIYELAEALGLLSKAAREGKLKAEQMQGASFTITSLGGIGGTAFTPIVNAPEVAIRGVSRSSMQPFWNGSEFIPRLMLPLSLSYDHRVVDGAYAVRFTTFLCETLSDVETLLEAIP